MRTRRLMIAALLLICSGAINAADVWHTSTLQRVYPQADGAFVLVFTQDSPSCTDVNSPDYYYVVVGQNGVTEEGAKKIYSAALTALALGKQFQINFTSGSACYVNRAAILN